MATESEANRRLEWDELYMGIALLASQRSPDKKLKVGACLVGEESRMADKVEKQSKNWVMGVGYNASPYGSKWPTDDEMKHDTVIHAEQNALIHSSGSTMGATMYVTLHPCYQCAKLIVQSGIKRVVYLQLKNQDEYEYEADHDGDLYPISTNPNNFKIPVAEEILQKGNVKIEPFHTLPGVIKDDKGNIKLLEFEYEEGVTEERMKFKINFNNWDYIKKMKLHEN